MTPRFPARLRLDAFWFCRGRRPSASAPGGECAKGLSRMNFHSWRRRGAFFYLKLLLLGALVFALAYSGKGASAIAAFAQANLACLAVALPCGLLMLAIRVYKWRLLLLRVSEAVTFGEAWRSVMGGMAFGLFTPGRVGELSRAMFLPDALRLPAGGLFVIDRACDLLSILVVGLAGAASVLPGAAKLWLAAAAIGLGSGALLLPRLAPALPGLLSFSEKPRHLAEQFVAGARLLRPRDVGANFLLALALMGLNVVSLYVLVLAFEPVTFEAALFCLPLILLTILAPLTPAGLGVREGAAVLLFQRFGVGLEAAVNATLLLHVINTLAPGVYGLFAARRPDPS
ncbi:MAG: hypothetical protein CFK52_06765 [Chloracidobacterium sp. CP2_5A]|nr:MAG: hypothetical protein CFK52_06765 [Chloracidobacterium sp. CP2_5A]